MKRLVPVLLAMSLCLAVLAGCGEDEKKPDARQSATPTASSSAEESSSPAGLTDTNFGSPAKGKVVRGKGYLYRMPAKWKSTEPRTGDTSIDTVAEEPNADDGFRDNMTVALQSAPAGSTLDELEESVAGQLEKTVPDLDVQPRVVIKGVEALHYRGAATISGVKYFLDEYVAIDDKGKITVISFSFSPDLVSRKRTALANSVLATWIWREAAAASPPASASPSS